MGAVIERLGAPVHGTHDGHPSLEQRFRIVGQSAAAVADVMWTKPMIGPSSILGERKGARFEESADARRVRAFSPVPGFRFDVTLRRSEPCLFTVEFGQPDRDVPYLAGRFLWRVEALDGDAVFVEEINTPGARALVQEPLSGPRASLRRWLFFRVGHAKVMDEALANIAALL